TAEDGTDFTRGPYRLDLIVTPGAADRDDTWTSAQPVSLSPGVPVAVPGTIERRDDVDFFAVRLDQGDLLDVTVEGQSVALSTNGKALDLDSSLRVFRYNGGNFDEVAFNDNSDGFDAVQHVYAPVADWYYLGISSNGNDQYGVPTGDPPQPGSS